MKIESSSIAFWMVTIQLLLVLLKLKKKEEVKSAYKFKFSEMLKKL